eukprot:255282-Pyramimonas_sp.AAC.1
MGIPLNRIPDVRRFYGLDLEGDSTIDFMTEDYVLPKKHVIAARITAENPDEGFKPTSGRIDRIRFQSSPSVWGYFSVGTNGAVHEFADSQFGHLFATGETREEARKALVLALKVTAPPARLGVDNVRNTRVLDVCAPRVPYDTPRVNLL